MAINTAYVADRSLQEYLANKDDGFPLAAGKVYFYKDNSRTELKSVYTLSGNPPDYIFVPLPNPITLSSIGTPQDDDGNDIVIYYLPQVSESDDTPELYFVAVYSANELPPMGNPQFTREAWPPNSLQNQPELSSLTYNFIPNGQFLLHNDIHYSQIDPGLLSPGSTVIAPGGWTFELGPMAVSRNFLFFNKISSWTNDPPQSPPYEVEIRCTSPNSSETIKSLRIKFNDVNKFSSPSAQNKVYTFFFSGRCISSSIIVTINLIKYFGVGGSSWTPEPQGEVEITGNQDSFTVPIVFGDNAGYNIGDGETYVAIDISFNTSQAFWAFFTDFLLAQGDIEVTSYPVQTNADTVARSLYGWTDLPDYGGYDLYLPVVNTPYGMTYDDSQIGMIGQHFFTVLSPLSTSPIPINNNMPADGTAYKFNNYSSNGIPFARLGNKLIEFSPINNIPLCGTGADFATAYAFNGYDTSVRITVNSSGTPINPANDFNTGFNIRGAVTYAGITTGSNNFGFTGYNYDTNTIICIGSFQEANAASGSGTSGMTVADSIFDTSIVAQQYYSFTVQGVVGSSLLNPSAVGKYFIFSNETTDYYMWFYATNESDPNVAGRTGIRLLIDANMTAQDVVNVIREAMTAYQISYITPSVLPLAGQYFTFQTNPLSLETVYVYYVIDGEGDNPTPPGDIGIAVNITEFTTIPELVTATQIAINSYQYASPDLRGMFLRGSDFTGIWDKDVTHRLSNISGLSGANLGTFEYSQILSHFHYTYNTPPNVGGISSGTNELLRKDSTSGQTLPVSTVGGSETRSVNTYVNMFIKY